MTNFDDIVVLSLFFAPGRRHRGATTRVVAAQYLAYAVILVAAIAVTFGAAFLPKDALPYLGLVPIAIGLGKAWKGWPAARRADHHRADQV